MATRCFGIRRPKNLGRGRCRVAPLVIHLDGAVGLLVAGVGIGGAGVAGQLGIIGGVQFAQKQIIVAHERRPFAIRRDLMGRGLAGGEWRDGGDGAGRRV